MPKIFAAVTFLLFALVSTSEAQVNSTFINGVVTDPQGHRVPQALVLIKENATGLTRETRTNSEGGYYAPDLSVGAYTVEFSKSGFANLTISGVVQTVGQVRVLNVTLAVATARQQETVNAPLVEINRTDGSVGAAIEPQQIDDLPLNGRNWANLTAIVPGAIDNGQGDQRTIRFAGHGLDDNNLTLDGVDATAVYNQEQREYMRLNIPLDSISEFQAQSQNFGADVEGGSAGGQVAVVSRSGTNEFHGDLFDFFRNDALDARGPFDGASPLPLLLNQFGASVGGPVELDKTFFFAAYEGLRQHLDQTQIGTVPSPTLDAAVLATSPVLAPVLAAFPQGTSPTALPNIWNYEARARYLDNEDSGMVRIDQHFSERETAFLRFNADEAVGTFPAGQLTNATNYDTKFLNGVAGLTSVVTPSIVNQAKFGFNQTDYHTAKLSGVPFGVSISGISALTGYSTTDYPSKSLDWVDDVAWIAGNHAIKFGGEVKRIFLNQGTSASESLTFNSTAALIADQVGSASYTAILPLKRQRKNQYWAYLQDEWKVTSNLMVTAGVRYNFFNVFHEIDHRAIPFDLATCGGYCSVNASFSNPRYDDIDPRLGVAWSHGNTVLRAGSGIYHTDGQEDDQNLPISNDVARYSFSNKTLPGLSYPLTPFLAYAEDAGLGVVSPRDLDRNRKDDYVAAWSGSVEQKLPGNVTGAATYLGNKGTDILTTTYVNLINPVTGVAPYPQFGPISWRGNVGNSTFHALQLNVRRLWQNGLLLNANYMWSHSINDGSIGGGESDTPQDSFCRSCDKGDSDDDVRHVFNASITYQLPFGAGKQYVNSPSIARALLGGWELSALASAQTGLPVNVTVDRANASVPGDYAISGEMRPNLAPGVPLTPQAGSSPSEWINPAAFAIPANGTFGNLGRNVFRAPGFSQIDLSLARRIAFGERVGLRLRADLFNVLNRAQYAAPNADLSGSLFGVITSTLSSNQNPTGRGTPRELQVSAAISF